jgi:hypothetical protein
MRTPQQIIGDDLYKQLLFEGYIVSQLSRRKSDAQSDAKPDLLERLEHCVGPWSDYTLADDIKVEIARLRAIAAAAADVRRLLAIMSDHETALHDILTDDEACDWQDIELRWDTDLAPDRDANESDPPKDKHGIPIEF